jgi:hypothetical protein
MLCPRPTRPPRPTGPEAHSPQSLRLGRVRSGPPKPALTKVFGDNWLGGLGGLGGSDMGTLRHDFPRGQDHLGYVLSPRPTGPAAAVSRNTPAAASMVDRHGLVRRPTGTHRQVTAVALDRTPHFDAAQCFIHPCSNCGRDAVLGTRVNLLAGQLGTWFCGACKPPSSH